MSAKFTVYKLHIPYLQMQSLFCRKTCCVYVHNQYKTRIRQPQVGCKQGSARRRKFAANKTPNLIDVLFIIHTILYTSLFLQYLSGFWRLQSLDTILISFIIYSKLWHKFLLIREKKATNIHGLNRFGPNLFYFKLAFLKCKNNNKFWFFFIEIH